MSPRATMDGKCDVPRRKVEDDLLGDDWAGIVMGHNMLGANHDIVACLDDFAVREADGVLLDDLFDDRLRKVGTFSSGRKSSRNGRGCPSQGPQWAKRHLLDRCFGTQQRRRWKQVEDDERAWKCRPKFQRNSTNMTRSPRGRLNSAKRPAPRRSNCERQLPFATAATAVTDQQARRHEAILCRRSARTSPCPFIETT